MGWASMQGVFLLAIWLLLNVTYAQADQVSKSVHLDALEVVSTTPLHGGGIDKTKLPYTVYVANSEQFD